MGFRVALCLAFLAFCSAAQYGKKGKRQRVICSGAPVGDLNLNLQELNGRWFNKFFSETLGTPSNRPDNIFIDFKVPKNSLRATEIVSGTNPVDGTCLRWVFRDFQLYDNNACVAEKGVDPESCAHEEWVHYIFGERRHMLFFFYCADENPGRRCNRFIARCLSREPWISKNDVRGCQRLWNRFNLGRLPDEDLLSGENACSTDKSDRKKGW